MNMRSVFYPRLVNDAFGDPALYVRLAHRGEALLFDCGDLHLLTTRETLKIREVFISHAHIDHLIGFDALLRTFLHQEGPLRIYGPPGLADRIAGRLSGYTWNLVAGYPLVLTVSEWGPDGGRQVVFRAAHSFRPEEETPLEKGEGLLRQTDYYQVRAVPLDHGDIVSLAFVLEEPLHVAIHKDALVHHGYRPGPWLTRFKDRIRQGVAPETPVPVPLEPKGEIVVPLAELSRQIAHVERGMKISYVTDAAPTEKNMEKIAALGADSHLMVIEATFAHRDLERAMQRNHLTARLAGQIARKARAARLLVFHHSPRYQENPELLADEAREAFVGENYD
jgi:ribonuclease Z